MVVIVSNGSVMCSVTGCYDILIDTFITYSFPLVTCLLLEGTVPQSFMTALRILDLAIIK